MFSIYYTYIKNLKIKNIIKIKTKNSNIKNIYFKFKKRLQKKIIKLK